MPFSASATASNDFLTGRAQPITSSQADLQGQRYANNLTTADLANGVAGALGILPAGHVPFGLELDGAQLDSNGTPALAYSIGILNAAQTDLSTATVDGGGAWVTGHTTGRTAGGSASGPISSRPMNQVTAVPYDRLVGIRITSGAATPVAGQLALKLTYRAA